MKNTKQAIALASAAALSLSLLAGCGGAASSSAANSGEASSTATATATTADGKKWITRTYTMNSNKDYVNFVFSVGMGSPQTVDVNYVTRDSYLEISSTLSGNKYTVDDVSST